MKARKWAIGALAVTVLAGMLVGCTPAAPDARGSKSHDFVIGLASEPPTFNLGLTTNGDSEIIGSAVFDTLVKVDRNFNILPGLAESWSANKDSTEFTFHLRKGVKWHDGVPFTSADVKFYFDKIIQLHPLGGPIAAIYSGTETPDDLTAIIKLKAPYGPFFEAVTANYLIPKHLYEGTDITTNPYNVKPVGTGPFVFKSYTPGDSVVLVRNDNYWGKQGDVDRIVGKILPDANARSLSFASGEVDFTVNPGLEQLQILKRNPDVLALDWTLPEHLVGFFNTANPILANSDVRQALYQAIDRSEIADKVYQGTGEADRSVLPNQITWANDESIDFTKKFKFDLKAAADLLDKAGYPAGADGTRFSLNVTYRTEIPTWGKAAELIKANFAKIGVAVNLVGLDPSIYRDAIFTNHTFDLVLTQLAGYADPSIGVSRAYECNPAKVAFRNPTGICDPAIDHAFAAAASVADRAERKAAFTDAAAAVAHSLATLPLVSINQIEVLRADKWNGLEDFARVHHQDWSALVAKN
jgi:peptide/nickel transport system substrate-binding protein